MEVVKYFRKGFDLLTNKVPEFSFAIYLYLQAATGVVPEKTLSYNFASILN